MYQRKYNNIIDNHQIYWSSDYHQVDGTNQNNIINIVSKKIKRSKDQSLDLNLSRANEIKISIISARAVPPSSYVVLSQTRSISSKIMRIKS